VSPGAAATPPQGAAATTESADPLVIDWSGGLTWDNSGGDTRVEFHTRTGRRPVHLFIGAEEREALGAALLDPPTLQELADLAADNCTCPDGPTPPTPHQVGCPAFTP